MSGAEGKPFRIVYLEDDVQSFHLVSALLEDDGIPCALEHVEDARGFEKALTPKPPDLILADFNLPSMDGLTALAMKRQFCPETPFIFVSGSLGEEVAIESLKNGATDFVLKDTLARLPPAVKRALAEAKEHGEKVLAEKMLRASEERSRRLIENAPDIIFRINLQPQPSFEYISPAVERITGYKPAQFYADPGFIAEITCEEDRDVLHRAINETSAPEGMHEIRWTTADGRIITTEQLFSRIFDDEGALLAVEGIARDVTNRKYVEQQLRMLSEAVEQTPVGVVITDLEGTIVFANPHVSVMTGHTVESLVGQNARIFRSGLVPTKVFAELWSAIESGRSWRGELANRRKDGSIVHVRTSISPVRGTDGKTRFYLGLQEDITQWMEDQERRRRLESQLFQAQKLESIGTLAGGIAHDFNNILTGILGFTELAEIELPDDHAAKNELMEIRSAGLRAQDLVAQILTFSRQGDPQLIPVDIATPVGDALKLFRASAPATIQIERNLVSGTILGDSTQIHQVVLNLCTNALHAMGGKQGTLTVAVEPVVVDDRTASEIPNLKPGRHMRLLVSDTGHGMEQQTISRIFDPFFTTKKPGEGTGLGLAMVQGIVHTHSGAMSVSSETGKGTTFELYFPLSTRPRPETDAEEPTKPGNGEEILVVDDEQSVGTFAATRLQQFNYSVTVFRDPREALEAFRNGATKFDAVVTDLTMPHITGIELIGKLRETSPGIPAIIISGYNKNLAATKLSPIPGATVLMKPFTGEELARSLHLLLRESQPVT